MNISISSGLLRAAWVALVCWGGVAAAQPEIQPPPVETPVPVPAEPELPGDPLPPSEPLGPSLPPSEIPGTPGPITPPPPEVVVPAPPSGVAPAAIGVILGGIDKVAARTARFDEPLKKKIFYNTLVITVHACKTRPPEEPPESAAFVEIIERKPDGSQQRIFSGWMFASSPALNALEHPVYDIWVVSCKTAPGSTAAPAPPNT